MLRVAWTLLLVCGIAASGLAQRVDWSAKLQPSSVRPGEQAEVLVTARIQQGWHIYGLEKVEGPFPTQVSLAAGGPLEANGALIEPRGIRKRDENFGVDVTLHTGMPVFRLPVRITGAGGKKGLAKVVVKYQACDEAVCDRPKTVEVGLVEFAIESGAPRPDRLAAAATTKGGEPLSENAAAGSARPPAEGSDAFSSKLEQARSSGILSFVWFAFTMGLLALLTPCVFPMIPITVSFFSKRHGEGGKPSVGGPIAYCLGIIGTFTALGIAVTAIFGASGIQTLATNPVLNLALALLFLALAGNLFGLFEIQMPAGIVNRLGPKARGSGAVAAMLMGLTFTLTSFTCTVPFVGTVLIGAAQGDLLYPVLGMLAFSTAFALPFFLLALFPQYLGKLPKSGSWLVTVKAFMGFLEIAAAVKFISNADLVWQLGLLTRPVFLAVWATIGTICGLYLLGWLRLPKDAGGTVGWPRRVVGAASIGAAIWCLGGIQGAPLGDMSAFLPPEPYPGRAGKGSDGFVWETKYEAALARAQAENKPVFIDFTGVTCTNCRWMEDNMFPRKAVAQEMQKFVLVKLFTDRDTPEDQANFKLQEKLARVTTLPVYVIVSPAGQVLNVHQQNPLNDEGQFLQALRAGQNRSSVARR